MKLFAFMLVAMATIVSCEDMQMLELTPALGSSSNCEVSLWCQDLETAERCDKVSYCTKWIWSELPLEEVSGAICDDCKLLVAALLAENDTIINFFCDPFLFWKKECSELVHKIIREETAPKFCAEIDLCPKPADYKGDNILRNVLFKPEKQLEISNTTCDECKQVVQFMKNNPDLIKTALDDFCAVLHLPESLCDDVAAAFNKELNSLNATLLCQKVDLCAKSTPLLGADLCTRGPAYWCASLDNAKECEAFDFCKTKVWV